MKDLTKIPHGKLSPEEQKEFERRARIVDDNNNPPVNSKKIKKERIHAFNRGRKGDLVKP